MRLAIIQARMGSTRLPGKVMKPLLGKPMLEHIITRVQASKMIDQIVIATTQKSEDNIISDYAKEHHVEFYRGSSEDVLDRYYQAAKKYDADVIVRITADDPLKDPQIIDEILHEYIGASGKYDYISNTIIPTYPIGLDIEVFSFKSLSKAWMEAERQIYREHVTPYIWSNPQIFNLKNYEYTGENLSTLRWTVDTKEDFEFVETVYRHLYNENEIFLMQSILQLLRERPEIQNINKEISQKKWDVVYNE
ncbi:glycosyltransferase family protein [uncultured Methanomethylovorans sp.]|uniref:glycosyltransferase family protein n=1 Tax=uncultured Methanomethylovorans sp. TaxID=183759 RepID=UPI002AA7F417|nr:glycosyltransferase family protein [uncultured Methanomethylovorans sp.]